MLQFRQRLFPGSQWIFQQAALLCMCYSSSQTPNACARHICLLLKMYGVETAANTHFRAAEVLYSERMGKTQTIRSLSVVQLGGKHESVPVLQCIRASISLQYTMKLLNENTEYFLGTWLKLINKSGSDAL